MPRYSGDPPATLRWRRAAQAQRFFQRPLLPQAPPHDQKQTPTFVKVIHAIKITIWTTLNCVISSSKSSLGRRDPASTLATGMLLLASKAERWVWWQGHGSAASEEVSPTLPQLDFHRAEGELMKVCQSCCHLRGRGPD